MNDTLEEARAALRQRQGGGARYDAANAPARDLDWARRGTAYFARLLNRMSDAALDAPSGLDGLSRRDVVAHIGYHARALSDIVAWARQDSPRAMPAPMLVDPVEVRRRATQPARALRNLFAHSEVHLNVEWRDLDDVQWEAVVEDTTGRSIPVRETPWVRARAIWLHAIDLEAGGRLADAPPDFIDTLTTDLITTHGKALPFVPMPTDRDVPGSTVQGEGMIARGRAADIALWLSGRGYRDVTAKRGALPGIPFGPPALFNL